MTTIAVNLESMVSDSMVTIEHKGIAYPAVKIIRHKGMLIGAAGFAGDCTRFLKWGKSNFEDKEPKWSETDGDPDEMIGIVLRKDGIYIWSQGDPEPERIEASFYAIGSGGKAARAAMIMGADPQRAVEIACQVDPYSELPLQVLYLADQPKKGTA